MHRDLNPNTSSAESACRKIMLFTARQRRASGYPRSQSCARTVPAPAVNINYGGEKNIHRCPFPRPRSIRRRRLVGHASCPSSPPLSSDTLLPEWSRTPSQVRSVTQRCTRAETPPRSFLHTVYADSSGRSTLDFFAPARLPVLTDVPDFNSSVPKSAAPAAHTRSHLPASHTFSPSPTTSAPRTEPQHLCTSKSGCP
jgi:hypothetical protein